VTATEVIVEISKQPCSYLSREEAGFRRLNSHSCYKRQSEIVNYCFSMLRANHVRSRAHSRAILCAYIKREWRVQLYFCCGHTIYCNMLACN